MADWIGHMIANWPVWAIILGLIVAIPIGILWDIVPWVPSSSRHEWPEDVKKREARKKAKPKVK